MASEDPAVAAMRAAMSATPAWLDAALVEEAVRGGGDEGARVKEMSVGAATGPGENFCSALRRVEATLADGAARSVVVKSPPPVPLTAAVIATAGYFPREALLLADIVPKMEALLKAAAPESFSRLGPRCLLHGSSPVDYLVLEDLQPLGFRLADRHRGLGLRHCLLALRTLARYHAASVALLANDPHAADNVGNPMVGESSNTFLPILARNLQIVANACRSWPGCKEIADDLEAFMANVSKKIVELHDNKPGKFTVILHGDFWTNNLMFRYEDGHPVELRMVDFQISRVASPAIDLVYFLSTSPSEEVSQHHEDLLLREYHAALQGALELLGFQAPPLGALLDDVRTHGSFALLGATSLVPLIKAVRPPDMAAVMSDPSVLFEEPGVRRWLERVLPVYKRKGWLDL